MIEKNTCKKCGKNLPKDYKHKKCEHCINKALGGIRKAGKVMGGIALTAAPFILNKVLGGRKK
ncbi:TPA: hypothetical protein ACGPAW_001127 [Streptococcus suis]